METTTMIKNEVIINGVTYEFAPREVQGNDCEECALRERCHEMQGDILCTIIFDDYMHKVFKRVKK